MKIILHSQLNILPYQSLPFRNKHNLYLKCFRFVGLLEALLLLVTIHTVTHRILMYLLFTYQKQTFFKEIEKFCLAGKMFFKNFFIWTLYIVVYPALCIRILYLSLYPVFILYRSLYPVFILYPVLYLVFCIYPVLYSVLYPVFCTLYCILCCILYPLLYHLSCISAVSYIVPCILYPIL